MVALDVQKKMLKSFMESYGSPTLKKASQLTGIQMTRLFRILNGYEMRLGEYLMLEKLIHQRQGIGPLDDIIMSCQRTLGPNSKRRIQALIERQLELERYVG